MSAKRGAGMKPDGRARLPVQIRNTLIRGTIGMYEYRSLENESRARSPMGRANKMISEAATATIPPNLDDLGVMQPWQAAKMHGEVKSGLRLDADHPDASSARITRSEERRVGKECRSRWSSYH